MQKLINAVKFNEYMNVSFAVEVKIILPPLTNVSHILTVSNYMDMDCSNDEFDLLPVYSGE